MEAVHLEKRNDLENTYTQYKSKTKTKITKSLNEYLPTYRGEKIQKGWKWNIYHVEQMKSLASFSCKEI